MLANTLVRRMPLALPLRASAQALSTWSAVPAGPPDPILGVFILSSITEEEDELS
jgi:hypothetical protein